MKPLWVFDKHIVIFGVYILRDNVTFNKRFSRPVRIGFGILKK